MAQVVNPQACPHGWKLWKDYLFQAVDYLALSWEMCGSSPTIILINKEKIIRAYGTNKKDTKC